MNEELVTLSEILDYQRSNKIAIGINHLDCITNSLFKLTQSLFDFKEPLKYHQLELGGKFFRFGFANQSILNLTRGNSFKIVDKETVLPDTFSINALARMQIEAFLIMFYLFFDHIKDSEKDFRYDVYKIHGLRKQSNFKISRETSTSRTHRSKIETELKAAIESLKSSSLFKKAPNSEQKKFLNPGNPKLIASKELFERSGLYKSRFDQMWQLYSNYAHNEHISDRQYNTTYIIDKSFVNECSLVITLMTILTSNLCINISDTFEGAKEVFNQLTTKEKIIIKVWSSLKN